MKIICKNSFQTWTHLRFEKNDIFYCKKQFGFFNPADYKYVIYDDIKCHFSNLVWYLNTEIEKTEFMENFYTDKELRALKIQKINETTTL